MLAENPKLMIELAIEMTKLTQKDVEQEPVKLRSGTENRSLSETGSALLSKLQGFVVCERETTGKKTNFIAGQPSFETGARPL